MTEEGIRAAAPWRQPGFAQQWAANDRIADMLTLPRSIAAALVAHDRPDVRHIVDIGSGPGDFLAVMLDEFPGARGLWTDASEAMREIARERLAAYAGRVDYALVDMTALGDAVPRDADVLTTSRASHHLDRDALSAFYADAAAHLAPGGWLVNLDHVGPDEAWDRRMRAVRTRFHRRSQEGPTHHHNYPLASVADHFGAFTAAGITDVEMVWRAFITCLFMGRASG